MARLLPDTPTSKWLEPCVGEGVFLDALASAGVAANRITAVELDTHTGLTSKCWKYLPGTDFLGWSSDTKRRFDRIIGNPPYLPLHRAPETVKAASLQIRRPNGAGTVPPKANCWYAFLCASLGILRPGGGLCFVLPSAWDYADYAADLREAVFKKFARVSVYRSDNPVFPKVLDGCVVLVADGYGQTPGPLTRRTFQTGEELIAALDAVTPGTAAATSVVAGPVKQPPAAVVRFGEVARVRIGGVTGASSYFLLTEDEREVLNLPKKSVRRVVTRSRHLTEPMIETADWQRLHDDGERVWLFWPDRSCTKLAAVSKYLEFGQELGVPTRQKVRARNPWYQTVLPPKPDGLMSGMTPFGPWICLNHAEGLTATNTLYTVHFLRPMTRSQQAAWSLSLLTSHAVAQHATLGRRYSGGLLKFEPSDVMDLLVPDASKVAKGAESVYRKAVRALLGGNLDKARTIADSHIVAKS